uniref:uncharacterized protein n=1 Tax=Semicossyphus pulcher TaxID=241346 RepID=UPI0037E8CAC3
MAPPRPTPAGQEEELITTVAPTIKEEHEDDVTAAPDFDVDFVSENVTDSEFVPHRGDTFPQPQSTTESTATTESVSKPTEEPDDHAVIMINTIQPDVPKPDESLITEPMFAEGKTEETILDSGFTTAMASDLTDRPTDSTELTSEEVFSSESTPSTAGLYSTTAFLDYNPYSDYTDVNYGVEALPPQQDLSPSSSDTTSVIETAEIPTSIPTDTTFMCNTQSGSEEEFSTTEPTTVNTVLVDSGTSAEDATSSTSVDIFDESATQLPERSGDNLTEDASTAEIGTEFFTSAPIVSAVVDKTTTPGTVGPDEQSVQGTTVMQMQNVSVDQPLQPYDSQSPAIPVVPDDLTPSIADGEPILQSGDPDVYSQTAVTITPIVSFINGKQEITLGPKSPEEKEVKVSSAEPQITKATKETQTTEVKETTTVIPTSVQKEVGESGRTPTYVKSDSEVTQTEMAVDQSPVTSSTELYSARDKAETTGETKSTSATPAVEDNTQSMLQTVYTPSSDDADGKTPTSTTSDSQSSPQIVEGGKETQAPKEFTFSTTATSISSGSASLELTDKTKITPAKDEGNTESSASIAPTLSKTSEATVTSQGESTDSTDMPSTSPSEEVAADAMSTPEEDGSGTEKPTAMAVTEEDSSSTDCTESSPVTPFSGKTEQSSLLTSSEDDGSGYEDTSISGETTTVQPSPSFSGSTTEFEAASLLTTTHLEGSEDKITDITDESLIPSTTISFMSSTESPSVTASRETETTVTAASSSYSTEKPTSVTLETEETAATSQTEKQSATPVTSSSFPTTDEESSGDQTTEVSVKETSRSTASSLFSTEKPTAMAVTEEDSSSTDQSPSVTASRETETSDTLKTAVTAASSSYSTEKPT